MFFSDICWQEHSAHIFEEEDMPNSSCNNELLYFSCLETCIIVDCLKKQQEKNPQQKPKVNVKKKKEKKKKCSFVQPVDFLLLGNYFCFLCLFICFCSSSLHLAPFCFPLQGLSGAGTHASPLHWFPGAHSWDFLSLPNFPLKGVLIWMIVHM